MRRALQTSRTQAADRPSRNAILKLGTIQYRPIEAIREYANNPRKHPEKQIVKLMASVSEFGIVMPLLVDSFSELIAGHAVLMAAKCLGYSEVPVLVADHLTPAQVKALRLAHNRLAELSSWDEAAVAIELQSIIDMDELSIDLLGWETAEIDILLQQSDAAPASVADPADAVEEPPQNPVSRLGDRWTLGAHRLLCASSLEADNWPRLMNGQTAAMAFTDAPYNVPVQGHVCGLGKVRHDEFAMASGEMSTDEFTAFLTRSVGGMVSVLKDGAILDLCMDWRHLREILDAIRANDLTLNNLCVWNKTNGGMGSLYRSKHELVLIAKKGSAPHTNNVELGKHGRYRTNVWDYAGVNSFGATRMEDLGDHPTVKPIALVADAIRDVTRPGEIVIDGFMGSGTTILAAERTERIGYGIEIAPGYVDVAIRRWEKMTGGQAVLEATGQTFAEVAAERLSEDPIVA